MFHGTRIPVVILVDNIAADVSMDEFYEGYPSLSPPKEVGSLQFATRKDAAQFLGYAKSSAAAFTQEVEPVLRWENNQARKAMGLELVG